MKTPLVKAKFSGYSDTQLNSDAKTILNRMTNNPSFPNPVPSLNDVNNAWGDYATLLPLAQTGDRSKIAAKNAAKAVLADKLEQLGGYVNFTAVGNATVLLTSGFPLAKSGNTPVILEKPVISVTNGINPGDMLVSVDAGVGAKSFVYQYTPEPITDNSIWISEGNTTKKKTFTGLESGKKFWFRVIAVGGNDQQLMSDIISGIVM